MLRTVRVRVFSVLTAGVWPCVSWKEKGFGVSDASQVPEQLGSGSKKLTPKNVLLGLQHVSKEEIELILRVAKKMKKIVLSDDKKYPLLKGKSIINLFMEPSTRTRSSFELAGKYLGADVINITKSGSSMVKGESLRDTLLTVSYMGADEIGRASCRERVSSPV